MKVSSLLLYVKGLLHHVGERERHFTHAWRNNWALNRINRAGLCGRSCRALNRINRVRPVWAWSDLK